MRSPSKRASNWPSFNCTPSSIERMLKSVICTLPKICGLLRVPVKLASATSEPFTRQPVGASADHTPKPGMCACTLPCNGADVGQIQASPWRAKLLLKLALAVPALALSHSASRRRFWLLPVSVMDASRIPALALSCRLSLRKLSLSKRKSPLRRVMAAFRRRFCASICAVQLASNSSSPTSPISASVVPLMASTHCTGMPRTRPAVCAWRTPPLPGVMRLSSHSRVKLRCAPTRRLFGAFK